MNSTLKVLPVVFILLSTLNAGWAYGQTYFRIECDISIKTQTQGGEGSLNLGKVYYDKNIQKLVYDITFPENEIWVVEDTISRIYRDNVLHQTDVISSFVETTIFHKVLEGSLIDFGLRNSLYQIDKLERDGDMVITTWKPPSHLSKQLGTILTSTVNNNLHGVVIKNTGGDILSRHIYKDYVVVTGLRIPGEIIQIMYKDNTEVYQVIKLSNILVNNLANEEMYNYTVTGE